MAVLVTGGTGFIGAHVVKELLDQGERVVAFDYIHQNVLSTLFSPEQIKEAVIVDGDASDLGQVARAMIDHRVDRIVHLASWLHPYCNDNPGKCAIQGNIVSQQVVLEAARIFPVKKLVWASSCVVFGPREKHPLLPVPNDADHYPVNNYGATKSFAEMLTKNFDSMWNVDTLGLRFTIVYGPGRVRGASRFFNDAVMNVAVGKPGEVLFSDDTIDWQYVKDIARLVIKCLRVGRTKNRVFNTMCDVRSVREGVDYLRKLFPEADISLKPGQFGIVWECDDSALQEEIGFRPEYTMEKGILETVRFARERAGLPPMGA
ncbi:MAG: NAD(P)-dependent oxidoreductase [Thermodesulfobacteriota bacterium]